MSAPVITIDGPSGSGKGSLCQLLSSALGWHLLDSGALYRIVGLAAADRAVNFEDEAALSALAADLDIAFLPGQPGEPARVMLQNVDVRDRVRSESSGELASKVAVFNGVREALKQLQRDFLQHPGLVADGRDMGTAIFTDAPLKIYLTASAEERAQRRYKQLLNKGESVNLAALLEDIKQRDQRDMNREVAPLIPADDAIVIDSTGVDIESIFQQVMELQRVRLS
jgi:cytidylate kinase